jgi:FtsH-binding integral membrane protein
MKWFIGILIIIIGALINYFIQSSGWEYCWGFFIASAVYLSDDLIDYLKNR